MRAVQFSEYGKPDVLMEQQVAEPSVKRGEVLVQLRYAGVSFADTYVRRGYYSAPHTYATYLPYIPGVDGVGTIADIGEDVDDTFRLGDVVTYVLGHHSYAEFVAVPAWKIVKVPTGVAPESACALMINGMTAYYLSHLLFPLQSDQTCLIHAGAGSVGQLLIQLALLRGARVITTVGSQEKEDAVRSLGVDAVVQYRDVDFVQAVSDLTSGQGVDVAYDSVGLDTYRKTMKCLKRRGMCSLFGAASGVPECVRPMEDLAENGSIFVTRSHLAHYMTNATDIYHAAQVLFEANLAGRLKVAIDPQQFDLGEAARAHERLESRKSLGKILLAVS